MKKLAKYILAILSITVLIITVFGYVMVKGHISFTPTPDYLLKGTGVVTSKSHSYGWTDTCYLVRMDVSDGQLKAVLDKYTLKKRDNFNKAAFNHFLKESPYWWTMKWKPSIEYYEAERDPAGFHAEAIVDQQSGYLLLRFFDT